MAKTDTAPKSATATDDMSRTPAAGTPKPAIQSGLSALPMTDTELSTLAALAQHRRLEIAILLAGVRSALPLNTSAGTLVREAHAMLTALDALDRPERP